MLSAGQTRDTKTGLNISEIMTILIYFHQSHYRNFKAITPNMFGASA